MTVTREQLLPLLQLRFHSVVCYPTGEEQENLLIEVVGCQDQVAALVGSSSKGLTPAAVRHLLAPQFISVVCYLSGEQWVLEVVGLASKVGALVTGETVAAQRAN